MHRSIPFSIPPFHSMFQFMIQWVKTSFLQCSVTESYHSLALLAMSTLVGLTHESLLVFNLSHSWYQYKAYHTCACIVVYHTPHTKNVYSYVCGHIHTATKWKRSSGTNLSAENNLPMFQMNALVVIRAKMKKCEQILLLIAMYYWECVIEGQRLATVNLPCFLITVVQQPRNSSTTSLLKCSSEGVIWMCRASFTNSSCPLPWSRTAVFSQ